jgi:hypothetical protein
LKLRNSVDRANACSHTGRDCRYFYKTKTIEINGFCFSAEREASTEIENPANIQYVMLD